MNVIPIRCFTCNKIIANKWETYTYYISLGHTPDQALNLLDIKRYCCRRMFVSFSER